MTRSRIDTFEWMTQSEPMRAPGPMVTLGKMIVRSPIAAPSPTATNAPIETSAPICASAATERRAGMHAGCRTPRRREQADGARERQIRIPGAQHRARRRRRIVLEDHGRGTRRAQDLLVFGVGEERDVARFGGLNARDAADLDVAVTLQPAVEPLGEFAQFHLAEIVMRTLRQPGVSS